jgi:uracil permease
MGTNYGEGIATALLSNAVTIYAVLGACLIAVLSSFSGHLEAIVSAIPTAVVGGLSLYLFGSFGMVGIRMLMEVGRENLLKAENLAIASLILILGIGGGNAFGGSLPMPMSAALLRFIPSGIPAIAVAALVGIILNLILHPGKDENIVSED